MKLSQFIIAGALAVASTGLMSCGGSGKGAESDADSLSMAALPTITVDRLLANPAEYAGDTVTVEGVCSHLCKHGGTKAFLANPDTTATPSLLMCVATEAIGGAFDPSCPEKAITVSGIVTPNFVTRSEVDAMVAKYEKEVAEGHCDAEARSGNSALGIKARLDSMANVNPADTTLTVGYYIETLSYAIPQ